MIIKLIRHGESQANADPSSQQSVADHLIPLTKRGIEQSQKAGEIIGKSYLQNSLIYTSPFLRTKQTLKGILEGAKFNLEDAYIREDPRLREVEHGYFDVSTQHQMIKSHGHFYYRYQGGESPADCYDRVSGFLESFVRSVKKTSSQQSLIVTHGLALRVFVMRFLHLTVEQFDTIANPHNADIVTIASFKTLHFPQFISGHWGVEGLRYFSNKD
ncbi:MAG TPA: histidine phosphatase family protein [Cyanothece sp. UBA12306]|nr:histidine phosphatase family protein [Cyanothece sp. UBA12306]